MLRVNLSVFIVLALFIADLCNARVVDYSFLDTQPDWRYADLKERQTSGSSGCVVYQCNPNSCSGASCYLPGVYQINTTEVNDPTGENLRLAKRILTDPPNIGEYLNSLAIRPTANNVCPVTGANAYQTVCTQFTFAKLPTYQRTVIGMGNTELTGCTVLCVVSARAVYMCHIWEDLNFPHVNTAPNPNARAKVGIQPVLNLISGNGQATTNAVGPALDKTLFNGGATDNTYVFIMTPRNRQTPNDASTQEHSPEINQLAALLKSENLIPGAAVQMYNYFATAGGYPNEYQGVALWEYDPNADNKQNANWRLWFEETNENGRNLGQDVI